MTGTAAWIRPLAAKEAGLHRHEEVRGSHCRTAQRLFAEWAAGLGFPHWFGHNWDAFLDCMRMVSDDTGHDVTIVVREAGELLADERPDVLAVLLTVLSQVARPVGGTPGLLLLVDDTPDRLSGLARRMADAGHPVDLLGGGNEPHR